MSTLSVDAFESAPDWTSSDATKVAVTQETLNLKHLVKEGTSSMKLVALSTAADTTVRRDLGLGSNWSKYYEVRFWIISDTLGIGGSTDSPTNWQFSFGESGYEEKTYDVEIKQKNVWQKKRFWIKNITPTSLDGVRYLQFKYIGAVGSTTHIDGLRVVKEDMIPDVELAMKTKLETLGYPVHIRSPEEAVVQEGTYPVISFYNYNVMEDTDRYSGHGTYVDNYQSVDGSPDTVETWGESVPISLSFQIDVWSLRARDDRKLQQGMMELLPRKYGYLEVNGDTVEVLHTDYQPLDEIVGEKRLYRKVFSVDVHTRHDYIAPVVGQTPSDIILDGIV